MKVTKVFHDLGLQVCVCSYDGCPNLKIISRDGKDVLFTGPQLSQCSRCKFLFCDQCSASKVSEVSDLCEVCFDKCVREAAYRKHFEAQTSVGERERADTEKNKNDTTLKSPGEIFAELKKIYSTHLKKMYRVPGLHGLYRDVRDMFQTPKQPDEETWLRSLRAAFEKLTSEVNRAGDDQDDDDAPVKTSRSRKRTASNRRRPTTVGVISIKLHDISSNHWDKIQSSERLKQLYNDVNNMLDQTGGRDLKWLVSLRKKFEQLQSEIADNEKDEEEDEEDDLSSSSRSDEDEKQKKAKKNEDK